MKLALFSFVLFLAMSCNLFSQKNQSLKVGDKAPEFQTLSDNGSPWNVKDILGDKNIVIYFYPAAMTGGCTKQACAYRDFKTNIESANAVVVGISGDNVAGLKLFKRAHDLNFSLLSDKSGEIAQKFGVPTRDGGTITREIDGENFDLVRGTTASRWTFIIDKNGTVVYINNEVDATTDTEEVLVFLKNNL